MYVVSGVSGQVGGVVAAQLKAAGKEVRVLLRNPDQVKDWEERGFQPRLVDLVDTVALTAALSGAEGAFLLVPPYFGAGIREHQLTIAQSIRNALEKAAPSRTVVLSSIGAELASGTGPIVSCHHLERLCQDIPSVVFLRAAYFMENWLNMKDAMIAHGVLPSFLKPEVPFPMVATADVGRAAAALLLQEASPPQVVQVTGPEELTPQQVANAAGRALEKNMQLNTVPLSRLVQSFVEGGVPQELAESFLELYQAAHTGQLRLENGELLRGVTTCQDVFEQGLKGKPGPTAAALDTAEAYLAASYLGDGPRLKEVLSSSLEVRKGDGATMGRDAFIAAVEKGRVSLGNFPYERRVTAVSAGQHTALVTARVRVGSETFIDRLCLFRNHGEPFQIQSKAFENAV